MAYAFYSARTSMFVGPKLPQLLFEKDISSVIAEVYTENRMMCATKCLEQINCAAYLFKSSEKPDEQCCTSDDEYCCKYNGTWSRSKSNRTCQRWDSQYPHNNLIKDYEIYFLESNLTKAEHYFRNPDFGTPCPWCYTSDPLVRWECCNLYRCFNADANCRLYNTTGTPFEDVEGYGYFRKS